MLFYGKRIAHMVFVLWAIATILFLMFRLLPADPTLAYLDPSFTEDQRRQIMHEFGLDQSLWRQYVLYLGNLLHGQFGLSFRQRLPVTDLVLGVLPNTLVLTLSSLLVAYGFGTLFGAVLAWKRGSLFETISIPLVLITRAAQEFWVGMVIFAFGLAWFPAGGATSPGAVFPSTWAKFLSVDFARHLVLPAMTLAIVFQGLPVLLMRSNMLGVMGEEFVSMARMKGLPERTIMLRHAARNALLPVVTAFALGFGNSVGGNVVVETVFSWPGLGRMLVDAVSSSDYPLAQGAFLLIAAVLVTMNLVADVLYGLLDPRIAHARQ
jgi:peptide/nickel transport system permease protein